MVNKLAKKLELSPYTLDDVIKNAEKTEEQQITITAIKKSHGQENFFYYQPIAIIGEKSMEIGGLSVEVYSDIKPQDLRRRIIKIRHNEVEEILLYYVQEIYKKTRNNKNSKIEVTYQNFDRSF